MTIEQRKRKLGQYLIRGINYYLTRNFAFLTHYLKIFLSRKWAEVIEPLLNSDRFINFSCLSQGKVLQ